METKQSSFLRKLKKNNGLILLALPAVLFIIVFNYIPLYGLVLPFKDFKYDRGFFGSDWIGLANFKFLFNSSDIFVATVNTFMYNLIFILLGSFLSVTVAIMLFELSKSMTKIYQTIMFFPYFLSWVIVAYIVMALLDMDNGVFNKILVNLGRESVMWYSDPKPWPGIIIFVAVWKGLGYGSVIYYAAIMGFNSEYYEASMIEGASRFQQVLYITVPLLKRLIIMMTMLQLGRIFYSDFGLFYYVPRNSSLINSATSVIDTYVYKTLRVSGDIAMSSAAGFYQAVVGFLFVVTSNAILRKVSRESAIF